MSTRSIRVTALAVTAIIVHGMQQQLGLDGTLGIHAGGHDRPRHPVRRRDIIRRLLGGAQRLGFGRSHRRLVRLALLGHGQLTSVTSAGTGLVGVILPDTTSSARYISYRPPVPEPGLHGRRLRGHRLQDRQRRPGVDAPQLAIAQADITAGAKVLLVDPIDSTDRQAIQAAAAAARRRR